jgi:hypothetical protein
VVAAGGGGGGNHQSGAGGFSGGASEYSYYYKAGFDVRGIPGSNGEGATGATRSFGGGGGYYTNGSQPWNSEAFKFDNNIISYFSNPHGANDSYGGCRYDQIKINGVPQYFLSITNNGAWNDEDVAGNGGAAGAGGTVYYTSMENIHAYNGDRVTDGFYDSQLYEYALKTNDEGLYNSVNGGSSTELTLDTSLNTGNNIVKVATYATNTLANVVRKKDGSKMVPTKIFAQAGYIRPTYHYNWRRDSKSGVAGTSYEGNEVKLKKNGGSGGNISIGQNTIFNRTWDPSDSEANVGTYDFTQNTNGLIVSKDKYNEYLNDLKDYRTLTQSSWTVSGDTATAKQFTRVYTWNVIKRNNQYQFSEPVFEKDSEMVSTPVTGYGQGIGSGAGNLEKSNGQMIQITN